MKITNYKEKLSLSPCSLTLIGLPSSFKTLFMTPMLAMTVLIFGFLAFLISGSMGKGSF